MQRRRGCTGSRCPAWRASERSRFAQAQVVGNGSGRELAVIARTLDHGRPDRDLWMTAATHAQPPAGAIPVWINEGAADLLGWSVGEVHE